MAAAIFDSIMRKKLVDVSKIHVSGPHVENLKYFKDKGCEITCSNGVIVDKCDIIFICVKPQVLYRAIDQIKTESKGHWENKIFISILAGTSIETIEKVFACPINLVRVMPNTAVAIGEGCCAMSVNKYLKLESKNLVKQLLASSGLCLEVTEDQINAIGALAGSGPAFMYLILEALADGGVKMGIPRSHAVQLASQTMIGAAKMVLQSGKHSAQLKDEVCSAGGTTITGIHALEKGKVRSSIIDAIEAATNRSFEISKNLCDQINKSNT